MNEEYKKNEFYESLLELDMLISELPEEYPDDDIVDDLDACYQGLVEKYQLLYNCLPVAVDKELDWCNRNSGRATSEGYEEGYVIGLKDAVGIFKQVRDQY